VRVGARPSGESRRWERCVCHHGAEVSGFAERHFAELHRRVLLLGGAGFDPRTLTAARFLVRVAGGRLHGVFLREERPEPDSALLTRAERQLAQLQDLVPDAEVIEIPVFEEDGAVGIGRHAVNAVNRLDLQPYTDLVVDFSALSIGSSFPITKLLLGKVVVAGTRSKDTSCVVNLHALLTASPTTDERIMPESSDVVGPVHGFQGRFGLDETTRAARLWIPQLRFGRKTMLARLFDRVEPHDVVPVLPFPAHDPRLGDRLIKHYEEEFDGRWGVDARSIVYADERNPLDFYRTLLRIDDRRRPVFASTGGSLLVLSPVGSKALALGAMMAAIERDLPILYVEALSYSYEPPLDAGNDAEYTEEDLVHVWLHGEAYTGPDGRGSETVDPARVR